METTIRLSEREREIIREHIGFEVPVPALARKYKVTPVRIRQILRKAIAKLAETKPKPFILATVSGGLATIWDHPDVEAELIDWDSWECEDPTRSDLAFLRETAERLQDPKDKKLLLREIQELEDRGVAEDEP